MKVALVSFEYPPDTAGGGIGTYVAQAARVLAEHGHYVEVFAASGSRRGHFDCAGFRLNLVQELDRKRFGVAIQPIFLIRHAEVGFHVVESPEYFADGREILKMNPQIAHVVKLHTPKQLLNQLNTCAPSIRGWLCHQKTWLGAMCRAKRPIRYRRFRPHMPRFTPFEQVEREYTLNCNLVVSPSQALLDWAVREWALDSSRTMVVPNPYIPSTHMLNLPIGSGNSVVGYFGKLEQRKGVDDLIEAIPRVLKDEPKTRFRFVGKASIHPGSTERFDVYLLRRLKRFRHAIEIVGPRSLDEMPEQYGKVDVCVFPSIWENFPNVCLEAMSAGRAIVASKAGGMAEMLEDGKHGLLIPPREPKAIADALVRLLRFPELRKEIGTSARKRVQEAYSNKNIGPQLERSYRIAMEFSKRK